MFCFGEVAPDLVPAHAKCENCMRQVLGGRLSFCPRSAELICFLKKQHATSFKVRTRSNVSICTHKLGTADVRAAAQGTALYFGIICHVRGPGGRGGLAGLKFRAGLESTQDCNLPKLSQTPTNSKTLKPHSLCFECNKP